MWYLISRQQKGIFGLISLGPWVGFNPDTVSSYVEGNKKKPTDVSEPFVSIVSKSLQDRKHSPVEVKLQNLINRLESAKYAYFKVSSYFNGRRYYLSPPSKMLIQKEADAICRLFGGYLVEVDSAAEHGFIRAFLNQSPEYRNVLTGTTDEAFEGNWLNNFSKSPARYIKWGRREPNGGRRANCLYFSQNMDYDMHDDACPMGTMSHVGGFLCENLV